MADQPLFAQRGSTAEVEEGHAFAPKFDADGLLTAGEIAGLKSYEIAQRGIEDRKIRFSDLATCKQR